MQGRAGLFTNASSKTSLTPGQRLLARLPRRSTQGERAVTLASAGALFVGVFALSIAVDDAGEAPSVLFVLPIALIAIKFGSPAGLAAAACALALFGISNVVNDQGVGWFGYVTRGTTF